MNNTQLKTRWEGYANRIGLSPHFQEAIWQILVNFYQIPHRSYHSLTWHVSHMLEDLDEFRKRFPGYTSRWNELEWSIWFHDIYDRASAFQDEYFSADLASTLAKVHTNLEHYRVQWTVLATTHCVNPYVGGKSPDLFDEIQRLICDLDLLRFTAPPDEFIETQARIRKEYAHLSEGDFKKARAAFLQKLLGRGYIFLLDEHKHLEEFAKERMQKLINGDWDAAIGEYS